MSRRGGDVHSNVVADLKPGFADPAAQTIATGFCGSSITSLPMPQSKLDAMRLFNPHLRRAHSDRRGEPRFTLTAAQLQARVCVVDPALDPASGIAAAARFGVDAAQPGAVAV